MILTQLAVHNDERNFVRKAVNWALRQIGKRNLELHEALKKTAQEIAAMDDRTARWIARDALREFSSETTRRMLNRRNRKFQIAKRKNH